jgi:hypothetical protein
LQRGFATAYDFEEMQRNINSKVTIRIGPDGKAACTGDLNVAIVEAQRCIDDIERWLEAVEQARVLQHQRTVQSLIEALSPHERTMLRRLRRAILLIKDDDQSPLEIIAGFRRELPSQNREPLLKILEREFS